MILALCSWLAAPAHAHVPHDVVTALAPAPGLDPARPWWLVADHDDASDLYRSVDGGRTWVAVPGACLADGLSAAAVLDDGAVALLGDGRVWWHDPDAPVVDGEADPWDAVTLPFPVTAIAGGPALFLAGTDGVWTLAADGTAEHVWAGPAVNALYEGAGGVVASLEGGDVAFRRGDTWTELAAPSGVLSATMDETYVYVGTSAGAVWRSSGDGWTACAPSPFLDENPSHPELRRLASDGTTVALAQADAGPATSTDHCATWTANAAPINLVWPDDLTADAYYDFTTLEGSVTGLAVGGDAIALSTYDGVASLVDGAWSKPPLKGGDYLRGVAFSTDFSTDGLAILAAYGCGPARAFDAGATFDCPGQGLDKPGVQTVNVPADADGLVPAYALSDRDPVRSDDGAATWTHLSGPWRKVWALASAPGGRLWALNVADATVDDPGDVLRSDDGGVSWSGVPGLSIAGTLGIIGVIQRDALVLAWTADETRGSSNSLFRSDDGGDTFALADVEPGGISAVATWPSTTPTRIIVAGGEGLDVDVSDVWTRAALPDPALDGVAVRRVVTTSDDTLVAATRTGRILTSSDGGDTWTDVGAQLSGQIEALAPNPDFASHREVIACTAAGAFLVDTSGVGTVSRWLGTQQMDEETEYAEFWSYAPPGESEAGAGAMLGTVRHLVPGTVATVWTRGTSLRLLGEADGAVELSMHVDGAAIGTLATGVTSPDGILASADGLADGLHLVELEVLQGEVWVDAAQATTASTPLGWTTTGDTFGDDSGDPLGARRGCGGCSTGGDGGSNAGAAGLLGLIALGRRRRWTAG